MLYALLLKSEMSVQYQGFEFLFPSYVGNWKVHKKDSKK